MKKDNNRRSQAIKSATVRLNKALEMVKINRITFDEAGGSLAIHDLRTGRVTDLTVEGPLLDSEALNDLIAKEVGNKNCSVEELSDLMLIHSVVHSDADPEVRKHFRAAAMARRAMNERTALETEAAKEGAPALAEGAL
ncbi:hypothetical protein ACQCSV_13510 [Pseudarthrobacter sp. S3]|uniref:hypothetical protein n=1 Tax=Pseudarthrobacter sp. S3 TaxID=3418419 RepID=UPI003CF92297